MRRLSGLWPDDPAVNHADSSPREEISASSKEFGLKMAKAVTELRADFQHLRRWRKSVEQAQSYTFKAMITVIVTGFVGAVWLGVKVMLGK